MEQAGRLADLEQVRESATALIMKLYDCLLIENRPEHPTYRWATSVGKPFALEHDNYDTDYAALCRHMFSVGEMDERMSENAMRNAMDALLVQLAEAKYEKRSPREICEVAHRWFDALAEADFPDYDCFVPVVGLKVAGKLVFGSIEFLPVEAAKEQISSTISDLEFGKLNLHRDCVAKATFKAEPRRATELLRARAEKSLNVLRYVASLVWYNEPARHVYVAGGQPSRISYAFATGAGGLHGIPHTGYTPLPLTVDSQFLELADNWYGLSFLNAIMTSCSPSPIEQSLLTAIQWYGDAIQEMNPLLAFIKFYTAIETATKRQCEKAKGCLPQRVSVLLRPGYANEQRNLQSELEKVIDERNAILHSGKADRYEPEYLAWFGRVVSRQVLNRLRTLIEDDGISTKDDLRSWIRAKRAICIDHTT